MLGIPMLRGLIVVPILLLAVASAEGAPPAAVPVPQLTAEPQTATPGSSLVLHGRGFPRNARIALLAGPPGAEAERVGGAQTGRRGIFSATIRIRANADAGRFVALACYDACRVKASTAFRIVVR